MNKKYIIYMYTSPSGKSYIGQTCNETGRIRKHRNSGKYDTAFARAIAKYGFENFKYTVIERDLDFDEVDEAESIYITTFNTLSPNGYNLTEGGIKGKRSEETKNRISNGQLGRILSQETKDKISASHLGEKSYMWGKGGWLSPRYGIQASYETREKQSQSRNEYNIRRGVLYEITEPNGKIVTIISLQKYGKEKGISPNSFRKILNTGEEYLGYKCKRAI